MSLLPLLLCLKTINAVDKEAIETELDGIKLGVKPATAKKCERCWHYCDDVGRDPEHPTICARCVENVAGNGEQRQFA